MKYVQSLCVASYTPQWITKKHVKFLHATLIILSRVSGNFPDHPVTFHSNSTLSRMTGKFPDRVETLSECLNTFRSVQTLSRASRNFPVFANYTESRKKFQSVWKLSRVSVNFPVYQKTF